MTETLSKELAGGKARIVIALMPDEPFRMSLADVRQAFAEAADACEEYARVLRQAIPPAEVTS